MYIHKEIFLYYCSDKNNNNLNKVFHTLNAKVYLFSPKHGVAADVFAVIVCPNLRLRRRAFMCRHVPGRGLDYFEGVVYITL